jgi:FixJ family two-component response regulator
MDHHAAEQKSRTEIFLLDDDGSVRDILSMILTKAGYEVRCFADSCAFLATARKRVPACILLDVFVPGKTGLELLRELRAEKYPAPVIMISGRSDVATAVSAMKLGALDFLEKPFHRDELLARMTCAIKSDEWQNAGNALALEQLHLPGAEPLSKREREVLEQCAHGASSKEAGRTLGISPRTIDDHRSRIRQKLGAKNFADLMRIVMMASRRPS